ncbi:MAG: GerMN domain-containing protein [Acidimicrobiales bacterium]|nr:GerMN domain-containing protein [Acidimicrobiales bacterium]
MTGRARRRVAGMGLALLGVVAVAGCGVTTEGDDRPLDATDVPAGLLDTPPSPSTTAAGPAPTALVPVPTYGFELYLVLDDRLVPVRRQLSGPPDLDDVLELVAAGPRPAEQDQGYRSVLGDPVVVTGTPPVGGQVTIDVGDAFTSLSGADQLLALAQVVYSVTSLPGVGRVAFTSGGAPIDVPRADGLLVAGSVSRDDYAALVAPSSAVPTTAPADATLPVVPPG